MSTSYNRIPGEPAFLANKKAANKSSLQQGLSDCCYSFSNLIIIFACIIGLYFTVKFINDDPLYDYGEHLLTLRFYRQLIYIIVVFPLVVLVPLFNAVSACFANSRQAHNSQIGQPSLIARIAYQIFVALLAFVALIFVAPSIKYSSLVKQIDFEFKRHMKFRYEKDFAYEFVDRIQREYACCDDDWYQANYNIDKIPLTCYAEDLEFSQLYQQTCPEAIGSIVSTRCSIIAACLVAILVALSILVALDVLKLISAKENHDVRAREQVLIASATSGGGGGGSGVAAISSSNSNRSPSPVGIGKFINENLASLNNNNDEDDDDDDGGFRERIRQQQQVDQNRLRSEERRRERPLLTSGRNTPLAEPEPDLDLDLDFYNNSGPSAGTCPPPAILTKAHYLSRPAGSRPKSPVFVSSRSGSPARAAQAADSSSPAPPRGVLKKTNSMSRSIDRDSLVGQDNDNTATEFEAYQRQLSQSLQSQRPLLNVRFAE